MFMYVMKLIVIQDITTSIFLFAEPSLSMKISRKGLEYEISGNVHISGDRICTLLVNLLALYNAVI